MTRWTKRAERIAGGLAGLAIAAGAYSACQIAEAGTPPVGAVIAGCNSISLHLTPYGTADLNHVTITVSGVDVLSTPFRGPTYDVTVGVNSSSNHPYSIVVVGSQNVFGGLVGAVSFTKTGNTCPAVTV